MGENLGLFFYCVKVLLCLFVFIWVRAAFPRYRYDQVDATWVEGFFAVVFRLGSICCQRTTSYWTGYLP